MKNIITVGIPTVENDIPLRAKVAGVDMRNNPGREILAGIRSFLVTLNVGFPTQIIIRRYSI